MDSQGRKRAAAEYRRLARGRSHSHVADLAGISDPATVRDFANAERWPQHKTRQRIEEALGVEAGYFEAVAKGDVAVDAERDPVEVALERSELIPWRRSAVLAEYQRQLYEQRSEVRGA